eukprot:SAG31_NODE_10856_length_1090_cov_0.833502_1_plen_169_part_00
MQNRTVSVLTCAMDNNCDGVLSTFMGRIVTDRQRASVRNSDGATSTNVRAVCVDERTALLLDTHTGVASAVGTGTGQYHGVYFLENLELPEVCRPNEPLTYRRTTAQRLRAPDPSSSVSGGRFDFSTWHIVEGGLGSANWTLDVIAGEITTPRPYGPDAVHGAQRSLI